MVLLPGWTRHYVRDLRLDARALFWRQPVAQGVELRGDALPNQEWGLGAEAVQSCDVPLPGLAVDADGFDKDRGQAKVIAAVVARAQ